MWEQIRQIFYTWGHHSFKFLSLVPFSLKKIHWQNIYETIHYNVQTSYSSRKAYIYRWTVCTVQACTFDCLDRILFSSMCIYNQNMCVFSLTEAKSEIFCGIMGKRIYSVLLFRMIEYSVQCAVLHCVRQFASRTIVIFVGLCVGLYPSAKRLPLERSPATLIGLPSSRFGRRFFASWVLCSFNIDQVS